VNNVFPLPAPAATLDEDAWEDLLNFIEERRVIPIIGPELLKIETEAGPRLLHDWLAERLAARLGVDVAQLPRPFTINDVVCWYQASHGRREDTYARMRSVLREATFPTPRPLLQLAEIADFDLFVTTTFDTYLEQAINEVRFSGAQSTEVIAYAPNRVADLATQREQLHRPVVYHLLGRVSTSPNYVISDEDLLEFVCALQSEHLTPEKLFHELEHNHLLLIGSTFSNWLARLFLRMAKRRRLSDPRDVGEVLADDHTDSDERLMTFLHQVSIRTRVYSGAEQFVGELHRRWTTRGKPAAVVELGALPQRFLPPEREMPDNAVFISYAREDLAAAQKLKAGLDAAGVRTWFDFERLEGGDDYDRKIQRNISRCSYFVPIVSAATQRRLEAYFRREWSYAIDRSRSFAEGAVFIMPVCIDGTDANAAHVPEKFKCVQFTRLPGGEVSREFAGHLKELLAERTS
jgi:hypothetical protein